MRRGRPRRRLNATLRLLSTTSGHPTLFAHIVVKHIVPDLHGRGPLILQGELEGVRVSESHPACVSVACAAVTVRFENGLVQSGSKSLSPLWSAKQPSLWRKSNSRKIRGSLLDVRSNPLCCRDCWCVSVAVMDSTELPRERPSARSTTIAA